MDTRTHTRTHTDAVFLVVAELGVRHHMDAVDSADHGHTLAPCICLGCHANILGLLGCVACHPNPNP